MSNDDEMTELCLEAALDNGVSPDDASACTDGGYFCLDCPYKTTRDDKTADMFGGDNDQ